MSQLMKQPLFFLGANSPVGFVSRFGECYRAEDGWRTYIIKGGPGTGKSTVMKRVADRYVRQNIRAELFPCSSDPSSLDGVIFPDLKVALLDGTSPHIVEPAYPGSCEQIINLGECWDASLLYRMRDEILTLTRANKRCHKRASSYLAAAGSVICDSAYVAAGCTNLDKAYEKGISLAKKNIPKLKATGREWIRYLSGITPKGAIFYKKTIDILCDRKIVISDEFGGASTAMMAAIRTLAISYGHEIISCYCPMQPRDKCEHIIIPALKLAFCTSNKFHTVTSDERVIHARRFMDMAAFHEDRGRLNFNRKAANELLNLAADSLLEAKTVHDELEDCYIRAMDFEKINRYTEALIKTVGEI